MLYVILCDSYLYENHFLFHVIFIKSKRAAIAALLLLILLNENSFIFYTFTKRKKDNLFLKNTTIYDIILTIITIYG